MGSVVAPNLAVLIGDTVGARLISHAGSLTNLAKCPASTVQILGAEKALFRALKTRSNTPKYGLIFHSSFIGRAGAKNKGRISRYLANKCSIASRIDCFSEAATTVFGRKMKEQVEDRLKFYETGDLPRKNVDVMAEAVEEASEEVKKNKKKEKKEKKRKLENGDSTLNDSQNSTLDTSALETDEPVKKKKKSVADEEDAQHEAEITMNTTMDTSQVEDGTPQKKKKKKKDKDKDQDKRAPETNGVNGHADVEDAAPASEKKKKKKKKSEAE